MKMVSCAGPMSLLVLTLLPAATKLGQGNVFTAVCDSVNRGEADTSPRSRHPPEEADTPPKGRHPPKKQTTPKKQAPPRDTVNERPVRILLECILVDFAITNFIKNGISFQSKIRNSLILTDTNRNLMWIISCTNDF